MPRIRPPRSQEPLPAMEDHSPPTEDIEIALTDDVSGETEIDLAPADTTPEPTPAPAPQPPGEDALVRAAEATRRAEDLQRQNAELMRRDREREEQLTREQTRGDDAEYNSILTAIAAEQATLEKAEADLAAAGSAGDWAAVGKIQRLIGTAAGRLDRLEEGKQSFDQRREAGRAEPPARAPAPSAAAPLDFDQKVASLGVPDSAKSWLRQHPELVNDAAKNEELGAAHLYLTKSKKMEPFSQAYFDALDNEFGFKAAPAAAPAPEPEPQSQQQPQRRSIPMTAPVSRDVPTASGQRQASSKITLTAEQRQIARTSFTAPDMTNEQKELLYARNLQKLQRDRASGAYPQSERN